MRKLLAFLILNLMLTAGVLSAQFEVNADDMRTIEDTAKSLDNNVALKNSKAALAETAELIAYFKQVETWYAGQPDRADAAGWARKSHETAAAAAKSVQAGQFAEAQQTLTNLNRTCKLCHDAYKRDN